MQIHHSGENQAVFVIDDRDSSVGIRQFGIHAFAQAVFTNDGCIRKSIQFFFSGGKTNVSFQSKTVAHQITLKIKYCSVFYFIRIRR